jgi:hypothetical protein
MGGWLGGEGRGRGRGGCGIEGYPSRRRSGGLAPEIFLKISIENLRFKGHVYAVFMYFLNIILHYIIPKRH